MNEEWILVNKQADFAQLSSKYNIPPLLAKIMINRDVKDEDFNTYLHGRIREIHNPEMMKDLTKAADMLIKIAEAKEQIAIVSDYDCDGVFSGMILYTGLKKIGANPVMYTPDRVLEGYGINKRIVDEIYNRGINYIITCDNGIAAYEEIEYAKSLGIKVIITDHHEVPYEENDGVRSYKIPPADAVCNPKQEECNYPYKGLCGGGVAYKLISYIYEKLSSQENSKLYDINFSQPDYDILLEYAAIATIADIMELTGENRIIVKEGLNLLTRSKSVGITALKKACDLDGKAIGTYHIGFVLGPCFNAAGRIETAKTAFDLLMCKDENEAMELAFKLKTLNDERKNMTEEAAEKALLMMASDEYKDDKVVVLLLPDCHESIAGIVAGRVKEKICRPVIVFTEVENGLCKGSGRSIQGYNMYDELVVFDELFEKYGGHAMAAGITLKKENVEKLRNGLNERCTLTEKDFVSKVYIDAELLFRHINEDIINSLRKVEPCGNANRKPLFAMRHVLVRSARVIGKNQNVLKLTLVDGEGSMMEGIGFNIVEEFLQMVREAYGSEQLDKMLSGKPNEVDVAITFYPDINEYNGRKTVQLVVQNFKVIRRRAVV